MTAPDPTRPPPGWYPDPGRAGSLRWWDGQAWGMRADEWRRQYGTVPQQRQDDLGLPAETPVLGSYLLAILVGVGVGAALTLPLFWAPESVILLSGSIGLYLGFYLIARWRSRRSGSGDLVADYGWRVRWRDAWAGLGQSLLARVLAGLVTGLLIAVLGAPDDGPGPQFEGLELGGFELAITGAVLVLLAPPFEELLFRGMIQPVLVRRWTPARGIFVTSVLFGLVHVLPGATWEENVFTIGSTFGIGLVLGRLAHRKGDLGAAIWTHGLFNLTSLLLVVAVY